MENELTAQQKKVHRAAADLCSALTKAIRDNSPAMKRKHNLTEDECATACIFAITITSTIAHRVALGDAPTPAEAEAILEQIVRESWPPELEK